MDQAAHELIANIYDAVIDADRWQKVADGVSRLFGGSIVGLGILPNPRDPRPSPGRSRFGCGMDPDELPGLFHYLIEETPWSTRSRRG